MFILRNNNVVKKVATERERDRLLEDGFIDVEAEAAKKAADDEEKARKKAEAAARKAAKEAEAAAKKAAEDGKAGDDQ